MASVEKISIFQDQSQQFNRQTKTPPCRVASVMPFLLQVVAGGG
jgi:hypothetical protein